MDLTSSDQRRLADDHERRQVARLLELYPAVSLEEEAEILRFLKKGPAVDVGRLASDPAVRPRLRRFKSDHARAFSVGLKGMLVAAAIVVTIVVLCVWLWDVGAGRQP